MAGVLHPVPLVLSVWAKASRYFFVIFFDSLFSAHEVFSCQLVLQKGMAVILFFNLKTTILLMPSKYLLPIANKSLLPEKPEWLYHLPCSYKPRLPHTKSGSPCSV